MPQSGKADCSCSEGARLRWTRTGGGDCLGCVVFGYGLKAWGYEGDMVGAWGAVPSFDMPGGVADVEAGLGRRGSSRDEDIMSTGRVVGWRGGMEKIAFSSAICCHLTSTCASPPEYLNPHLYNKSQSALLPAVPRGDLQTSSFLSPLRCCSVR
jgi:hypothetical protein